MHSVSKHVHLLELTAKIWMKIEDCQRRRCSPMTVVSGNIRFVTKFEGVPWREGVKQQRGNRKHGFSRLSTLRLRQLWKSDQSYYTVIFSLLLPVHWPQNTWPLMTLNGLNIHFYCAMHFSAKGGLAIVCRLSVRLSVCPSVCLWRWWIVITYRLEFFKNNFTVS